MKAILQRVISSKVSSKGLLLGQIGRGLNILLGIGQEDNESIIPKFVEKIINLRIFADEAGKMNLSILDIKGEILLISQFTLYADTRGGRRPSFVKAASPELAEKLYNKTISQLRAYNIKVARGEFGGYMAVDILNDGPTTIILDSNDL